MSRIAKTFEQLKASGRRALIPYVTAGDPNPEVTVPILRAMVKAGADMVEIGVPFSDPMADGPVIQRSSDRALKHGVSLADVLRMVRSFRESDAITPVVLMGYANPIESMGVEAFAREASAAGVDGIIVVDYPPEESAELAGLLRKHGIDLIFFLAPTSTAERVKLVAKLASGYIYYVSLRGVTGAANIDVDEIGSRLAGIRRQTSLPLCVGFGIRDGASAKAVSRVADGAIIGSRVIQEIEAAPAAAAERVGAFLREVRQAMDGKPA